MSMSKSMFFFSQIGKWVRTDSADELSKCIPGREFITLVDGSEIRPETHLGCMKEACKLV